MSIDKKKLLLVVWVLAAFILAFIAYNFLYLKPKNIAETQQERTSWGVESQESLAKNALESFLLQEPKEKQEDRNKRLGQYFVSNSPIFNYVPLDYDLETTKISGKVKSLSPCEEQEGGSLCLIAETVLTVESPESKETFEKKYWITITKTKSGSFGVYDTGIWK